MAEVDLGIVGRSYRVACRAGEEDTLRAAAALVDGKSREALAGLGSMTESRQLLFAALLLADQIIDKRPLEPAGASTDPALTARIAALAERLERLADSLEKSPQSA
ncbi:MAG: cell division protein ZapA [Sphingomicrobium sp.]